LLAKIQPFSPHPNRIGGPTFSLEEKGFKFQNLTALLAKGGVLTKSDGGFELVK
jgi:hypothetical protein